MPFDIEFSAFNVAFRFELHHQIAHDCRSDAGRVGSEDKKEGVVAQQLFAQV